MRLKRLPPDDLAVAEPERPRALALMSDITRLDLPEFRSPQPDHSVAFGDEPCREDARPHVLVSRFKPIAQLVMHA
jgi:hypothetical protein